VKITLRPKVSEYNRGRTRFHSIFNRLAPAVLFTKCNREQAPAVYLIVAKRARK
jgi:hypothetical protein